MGPTHEKVKGEHNRYRSPFLQRVKKEEVRKALKWGIGKGTKG